MTLTLKKIALGSILISRKECQLPFRNCLFTFDDGPAGKATEELLLVLREFGVKACFCVVGSQVVARPEQARAIASAGHLLVNHTFHHHFADLWHLRRLQAGPRRIQIPRRNSPRLRKLRRAIPNSRNRKTPRTQRIPRIPRKKMTLRFRKRISLTSKQAPKRT